MDKIIYEYKCGKVYALEKTVPIKLQNKYPYRALCSACGKPFPNQEIRNRLLELQSKTFFGEE